jgi:hypothetical protein
VSERERDTYVYWKVRTKFLHVRGRGEMHTGFWWGNLREKYHLQYPGVDERIILRWIFRKRDVGYGMDWSISE